MVYPVAEENMDSFGHTMKKDFLTIRALLLGTAFLFSSALYADEADDDGDCPLVVPEFDHAALLTREERIQMMEQALDDALSRVQNCRQASADKQNDAANNAAGSAAAGISGGSAGADGNEGAKIKPAVASDTIAGQQDKAENIQPARPASALSGTEISGQRAGSMPVGTAPKDIPPADNDNIIARQIREAASAESDPEKQQKLWNEYRRYKGLPEK